MKANPSGKQPIDVRARVIQTASGDPRQAHGESANSQLVADFAAGSGQAVTAIDPDSRSGIDQDIGDQRICQEWLQRARSQDLRRELHPGLGCSRLPQNDCLIR